MSPTLLAIFIADIPLALGWIFTTAWFDRQHWTFVAAVLVPESLVLAALALRTGSPAAAAVSGSISLRDAER